MPKINTISFSYHEFDSPEDLDPSDRDLVFAAREAALKAYAPYSKFRVGAAIRLASGTIVCGTNVENAAFPSGICAERNALANSVSNHSDDNPIALAIAALTADGLTDEPVPPCGNCRQVISEEESRTGRKIRLILSGKNKCYVIDGVANLLPMQFNKINLMINLP
jgi:cytidine deaminase